MTKENNKRLLKLMKPVIIIASFCLLFHTALILFFTGLLNGGIGVGCAFVLSNSINSFGANPTGAFLSLIFKIILLITVYQIYTIYIEKSLNKPVNHMIKTFGREPFLNKSSVEIEAFLEENVDFSEVKYSENELAEAIFEKINNKKI
jgi:hypothetical protein